jgi:exopolyphosphatase / guanosine-5'-triphosphate,3'-diphosphate pyrophosphatase
VLRLRDHWLHSDPPSPVDTSLMAEWVRTVTGPTIARFAATGFDVVALTSGTALALARLAGRRLPRVDGIDRFELTLDALLGWERRLASMTAIERAEVPGLDPGRVDTIVPGAVILRSILEATGADKALVCDAALREGVIADYLAHHPARAATAIAIAVERAASATSG